MNEIEITRTEFFKHLWNKSRFYIIFLVILIVAWQLFKDGFSNLKAISILFGFCILLLTVKFILDRLVSKLYQALPDRMKAILKGFREVFSRISYVIFGMICLNLLQKESYITFCVLALILLFEMADVFDEHYNKYKIAN